MKKAGICFSVILVFLFAGLAGCATTSYGPLPSQEAAGYGYGTPPQPTVEVPQQPVAYASAATTGAKTVALQEDTSCGNPYFVNRKNWESDYAQFGVFYQTVSKGSDGYKIIIHGIRPTGSTWEVFFVDCARACPSPQAAIQIMQSRGYQLQSNGPPRGEPSGKHPTVDAGRVLNY